MADIPLWSTVIHVPLVNAAALAAVDITLYSAGTVAFVNGVGNFYYDPSSIATSDNITVIQPGSGPGRWLIQLPTVSQTNVFLGRQTALGGPVEEIPFTYLGQSIVAQTTSDQVRNLMDTPAVDGTDAVGTWPIDISGSCGNYTGPAGGALSGNYPDPTIANNAIAFSSIQELNANTLIGNNTGSQGNAVSVPFSTFLQSANNLSDVASASTSRTNLGLGLAATKSVTDNSLSNAAMISSFTNGSYAVFDNNGSLVAGSAPPTPGANWTTVTAATASLVNNQNYSLYAQQDFVLTLPLTANVNDIIKIVSSVNSSPPPFSITVAQNAGQNIILSNAFATTVGVTGTLACSYIRSSFSLMCVVADTQWIVFDIALEYGDTWGSGAFTVT